MAFPRPKISKFSGGACPQTPLVRSALGAYEKFVLLRTSSKSHATPLQATTSNLRRRLRKGRGRKEKGEGIREGGGKGLSLPFPF